MGSVHSTPVRILGIDPGLRITGYACIVPGPRPSIVEAGVFRLVKGLATSDAGSVSARLEELDHDFRELLARVTPEVVAVEGLFSHYGHPATAIVMGHARGVLLLAIRQRGLRLIELKPAQVKKSCVGFGGASKGAMQRAMQREFALAELPTPPDLADALGIALSAATRLRLGDSVDLPAAARRQGTRQRDKFLPGGVRQPA